MWQVLLYINPTIFFIFLAVVAVMSFVCAMWIYRNDGSRLVGVIRLALLLWIVVILRATVYSDAPLGSSTEQAISWIPGEGLWQPSGHALLGISSEERAMIFRLQAANAAMFVPLGALTLFSFPSLKASLAVAFCFLASVAVEVTQFLMAAGRVVDVDDVLFNTAGAAVGILIVQLSRRITLLSSPGGKHRP